jgi:nicotinamidase-related amidase
MHSINPGAQIHAKDTALVMIDFQPKLMLGCTTIDPQTLVSNAIALAEIGVIFELPIITTGGRPDDPYLTQVLAACGPTRIHVERYTIDSFETPEFVQIVEKTGRKTLVMAGITTDLCVLMPALSARAAGYAVQVVVDASGCFTRQIEEVSLRRLEQAGVALTTWATFAAELHRASNWQEGVGPKIMQSFNSHHAGMALIGAMSAHAG